MHKMPSFLLTYYKQIKREIDRIRGGQGKRERQGKRGKREKSKEEYLQNERVRERKKERKKEKRERKRDRKRE